MKDTSEEGYGDFVQVAVNRHLRYLSAWRALQTELRRASTALSKTVGAPVYLRVTRDPSPNECPVRQKHDYVQHHLVVLKWQRKIVHVLCRLHVEMPRGLPISFHSMNEVFGWHEPNSNMCSSWAVAGTEDEIQQALKLPLSAFELGKTLCEIKTAVLSSRS